MKVGRAAVYSGHANIIINTGEEATEWGELTAGRGFVIGSLEPRTGNNIQLVEWRRK